MNYDVRVTPHQLKKAAEWCESEIDQPADVELAVDDRMLVAQQGDDLMAWDTGGEEASEVYLDANPPLDPTGSDRLRCGRLAEAWATLMDYIEGVDDLTDEQCAAVDVLSDSLTPPVVPS